MVSLTIRSKERVLRVFSLKVCTIEDGSKLDSPSRAILDQAERVVTANAMCEVLNLANLNLN